MRLRIASDTDLDWARRNNDGVRELEVGARLQRSLGTGGLILALRQFPDLRRVVVADDYLRGDKALAALRDAVAAQFPRLELAWTYDLLIDGKHGR